MKFAYCSDLHLNFGSLRLENKEQAEVLILAGDVMEADDQKNSPVYMEFFEQISKEFNLIFYIMGNHEFWGGNIPGTVDSMRKFLPANVIILHNERYDLHKDDGSVVSIVGGTCWTDLGRESPLSIATSARMKDFTYTTYSNEKSYYWSYTRTGQKVRESRDCQFGTNDWLYEHAVFLQTTSDLVKDAENVIVVTHHAPSTMSVDPMFANDIFGNDAYCSDLSNFIMDRPQIKNWIHGHMHCHNLYMIDECTVRSNPRGYHGHEPQVATFKLKYFDA